MFRCLFILGFFAIGQLSAHSQEIESNTAFAETLDFELPVDALIQTQARRVIRAKLHTLTRETLTFNPVSGSKTSETLAWSDVKVLSLPAANIKFNEGESVDAFLRGLAERGDLTISVRKESGASSAKMPMGTEPDATGTGPTTEPESTIEPETLSTSSFGSLTNHQTKVTITCSNCMREVSGDSSTGQTCPHCGIYWAENPFVTLPPTNSSSPAMNGNVANPDGHRPNIGQPIGVGPGNPPVQPGGLAPNIAPPPIQLNSGPQEMTLATVPAWLKATIFFIAIGAFYYYVFYLR